MNRKIILIVIALLLFISLISGITYAFFAMDNINLNNEVISNAMSEKNNMVFDVIGGEMSLGGITAQNIQRARSGPGRVIAENNTTLTINFTPNTDYNVVCNYDIVYEWTSSDTYTAHSPGATEYEFTIQGLLTSNNHVNKGTNNIYIENDLSTFTFTNNITTVVSGAQIDGIGNSTSTAVWELRSKFYNVRADQSAIAGKTYAGRFKVTNVSCETGTVILASSGPTKYWYPWEESDWNYSTHQWEPIYTFSDVENDIDRIYESGLDTGSHAYIGLDSSKLYTCATINGHEICLNQPYTQYGLEGHTYCNSESTCGFTNAQQTSAKQALYQAFNDAGIVLDIDNDCIMYSNAISCQLDDSKCLISYDGSIYCSWDGRFCPVLPDGSCYCSSI